MSWFSVRPQDFRLLQGEPLGFPSTNHGRRTFCPRCGTPLTFESTLAPGILDVTTCSLDAPGDVPPADDTHAASKLPWVVLDARLPHFAGYRGEG